MIFLGATIRERLATLEAKVDNIQDDIADIKNNCLATIQRKLEDIEVARTWRPKDYVALISSLSALAIVVVTTVFG